MKSMKISRQSIYLLLITIFLLVFVLLFSFFVLIPSGQAYREARSVANKHNAELTQYEELSDATQKELQTLQQKHKNVIAAFENRFNKAKFIAQNRKYFQNLTLTRIKKVDRQSPFDLYEVNASSKIDSPTVFYDFLDSLSKESWVIGVNFPIHFQKEGELILSSFTMRVYNLHEEESEKKSVKEGNAPTSEAPHATAHHE